jgi:hypothetical protein
MEGTMAHNNSPDKLPSLWQSQSQESASFSAEELRRAATKLARRVFRRNLREYAAAAIVVAANVYYIYLFHTVFLRLGAGLIIVGILFVVMYLAKKGSAKTMEGDMERMSCVEFHRSELVRQRDLLLSVWKWYLLPLVPGLAVFILGEYQAARAEPEFHSHAGLVTLRFGIYSAFCVVLFYVVGRLNRSAAGKLQKRIDSLDALILPSGGNASESKSV